MVPQRDRPGWLNPNSALVIFLSAQALFALIWAVRTDSSVDQLQHSQMEQDVRINSMDVNGTRRLAIIDDRQMRALMELEAIQERLSRLEKMPR